MNMPIQSEPVGLVLSGGGAKGAFQAGVWKALCEQGIADRVRVISGTSVGAINALAFTLLRDPEHVRELWFQHVDGILNPNFNLLNPLEIIDTIVGAIQGHPFPFLGIFDRPGLVRLLEGFVNRTLAGTGVDVYATAVACSGNALRTLDPSAYQLTRFHLNEEESTDRILKMVLASSAIPWGFAPVDLDGVRYVDGSFFRGDNVPIAPILEHHPEIKTIYVVRCNSRQVEPFQPFTVPGCQIIEICPRNPLPGRFDDFNVLDNQLFRSVSGDLSFSCEYARKYFTTGYRDGLAALRPSIRDAQLEW